MIRTAIILATLAAATAASLERHAAFDKPATSDLSNLPKPLIKEPWQDLEEQKPGPEWIQKLAPTDPAISNRMVLPPVEHDHPYTGKLTLIRVKTEKEVSARCPPTTFRYKLGCAFPATQSCRVIIVADNVLTKAGYTYDTVYRHEIAHCNGWDAHHWGARQAPTLEQAMLAEMAKNLPESVRRGLGWLVP